MTEGNFGNCTEHIFFQFLRNHILQCNERHSGSAKYCDALMTAVGRRLAANQDLTVGREPRFELPAVSAGVLPGATNNP